MNANVHIGSKNEHDDRIGDQNPLATTVTRESVLSHVFINGNAFSSQNNALNGRSLTVAVYASLCG